MRNLYSAFTLKRFHLIILVFLLTGTVSASEVFDGENCRIDAQTTIQSDVLVLCGELIVEGVIDGNLIGAARTATIEGEITGSVYLLGGELRIEGGRIGKDVHFGGLVLDIGNRTTFVHEHGGIISASLSNTIHHQETIPGSITMLGYQLIVEGDVQREINFTGTALSIAGEVNGNVTASVGDPESRGASSQIESLFLPFRLIDLTAFSIELIDPGLIVTGNINGTLSYRSPNPINISGDVNSTVYTSTAPPLTGATQVEQSAQQVQRYLEGALREFLTLFSIGTAFLLIIPRTIQIPLRDLRIRPLSTLGVGLLSFILSFPIVLILMVLSVVIFLVFSRLPLGSLPIFVGGGLGLANIGGASVFYFTAIFVSRLIVALAIGRFLMRLFFRYHYHWRHLFISMVLGVLILSLLAAIPVIGWGINALALFLGLGAILSVFRRQLQRFVDTPPTPSPPARPYTVAQQIPLAPEPYILPALDNITPTPPPTGMDNLPEGFNWWQEDDTQ